MIGISIIIPHLDQADLLRACLDSIADQVCDTPYEVIILDGSRLKITAYEYDMDIIWISTDVHNPYVSRNLGIEACSYEYIILLDAACRLLPGYLRTALRTLQEHHIAAGRFSVVPNSDRISALVHPILYLNNQKNTMKGYGVPAGNLLVRKSLFDEIGPFDTESVSGNDISWTRLALSKGYDIQYAEDCAVTYPGHSYRTLLTKVKKFALGSRLQSGKHSTLFSQKKTWRSFAPMHPNIFSEALRYRNIQLSWWRKWWLYLLVWRVKMMYARYS